MNGHEDPPSAEAAELLELDEDAFEEGEFTLALDHFRRAWETLPAPREEAPLAVQILVAIGDAHFQLAQWEQCHEAMQHALRCGLPVDHPFGPLRLGQSLYELGNEEEASR
jgi:tetratricopeptide (TPR) repeat protein